MKDITCELLRHAEAISYILKEEANPYVRIEISSEGVKKTSVDFFKPTKVNKDQIRLYG